jgi:1,4-dihydroxy-2-naphthoate octaprenyltransferase
LNTITVKQSAVTGWVKVFRDPPFYLVGVLPFGLGTVMAIASGETMVWGVWALGSLAVALIMAMTFLVNEYFDFETDSANSGYNKFSGGSRTLPKGLVPKRSILIAAGVCALLAAALGLAIQFVYQTGPLTLPLGIAAMVIGYAYTGRPFQLIYRGFGELFIGLSVGWMPVFIAYYLLAGLPAGPYVSLMSLPIALSIVMVILINEYPDYESDKAFKKQNLVARFGRERMVWLYGALGLATTISLVYLGFAYFKLWEQIALFFPGLLGLGLAAAVIAGLWKKPETLEKICLATIILNLSTIIILIAVVWP